jgi:hypothetical protein
VLEIQYAYYIGVNANGSYTHDFIVLQVSSYTRWGWVHHTYLLHPHRHADMAARIETLKVPILERRMQANTLHAARQVELARVWVKVVKHCLWNHVVELDVCKGQPHVEVLGAQGIIRRVHRLQHMPMNFTHRRLDTLLSARQISLARVSGAWAWERVGVLVLGKSLGS